VVLIVPGVAVALALGSALAVRGHGSARMVGVATGGSLVAILLHLPWSLDYLLPGTPASAVTGVPGSADGIGLAELVRFEVGPIGGDVLGWALLVAAALPLLIGQGERHAWAVRGWALAIAGWGTAWLSLRGDLPVPLPAPEALLAPAAVGLALAAAMGVAAFERDLPGYRFGWRQVASGVAAAAIALATLPILGATFDGRWSMPAGDHARALRFLDAENDATPFRVLWLGDPDALPLGSWELTDELAYATTDAGTPRLQDLVVGSDEGSTGLIADVVDLARTGQTARLGRLLAPMGVRYVVLAERLAPAPFVTDALPAPRGFKATLDAQLDLEPLDVPAGLSVYRNQAALPLLAAVPSEVAASIGGVTSDAAHIDLSGGSAVLGDDTGHLSWKGTVPSNSEILIAEAHSDGWQLEVDGRAVDDTKPFGWATGYSIDEGGPATFRYRTAPVRYGLLLLQVLVWLWALRSLVRIRLAPALPAAAPRLPAFSGPDAADAVDDDRPTP
jgi:hypothetical protein